MSEWGTGDLNANRIKQTYVKGFLDISGGSLIVSGNSPLVVQKTSSLQVMASESNYPRVEFKPGSVFTVNPGGFDVSYTALATLGFLGVSFEQSTADINSRVKYLTTSKTGTSPNEIFSTNIGNTTTNSNLNVYGDTSLNGKFYTSGTALFVSDVSINGNLDIGSGSSSVFINKDVSAGIAFDVSGLTILRNTLNVIGDASLNANFYVGLDSSLNGNLSVGKDLSLNGNLYVSKRSLFTLDVSMSQNLDIGSGSNSVAINKDISAGIALDVSGVTVLRRTLNVVGDASLNSNFYVVGDSSFNGNLSVGKDLSLNGNLYVSKRSVFTLDVSMHQNLDIGSGSNSVAINKDISAGIALDVSGVTVLRRTLNVVGDLSLNSNFYVVGDSSLNGNLSVGNDLSLNGNLYVVKRSVFTLDVSMHQNLDIGSGSNSVAINKDISAGIALDVSGLTVLRRTLNVVGDLSLNSNFYVVGDSSLNGNLAVGKDLSLNGNLYVSKRSLFTLDVSMHQNLDIGSGSNSVAINKDISAGIALDVSGVTVLRRTLNVVGDLSLNSNFHVVGDSSLNGNLAVGKDLSLNGNLYVSKRSLFTLDVSMHQNLDIGSGSNSVAINKDISAGIALDVSGVTVLRRTLNVVGDLSLNSNFYVVGDSSLNGNLSVGGDLSLNSNLYVVKRSVFIGDVSMNGNTKLGRGINSVAINKDISGEFALDISGATKMRGGVDITGSFTVNGESVNGSGTITDLVVINDSSLNGNLYVGKDSSLNGNLYVVGDSSFNGKVSIGNDLSLNGNLYVVKRSLFALDVSMSQNLDIGSGSSSVAINKDISSAFALDVSGLTVLRNTLYVASDVSMNANLYVNNDLSLNGNLYVVKRSLFALDVSINGNIKLGSGTRSVAINKDISSAFALDVSGLTVLRNTLYVGSDVSMNANLYVNNDLSLNGNLYVVKRSLFTLDVSMNGNVKLGSGTRSVAINKDISSAFALDVSGLTVLRNTLYVGSDVSMNANLYVNNDLSLNGNLYVVKRSLFTLDVSMSQNLDIGTGSNSVAINKDISSAFALDVSGLTVLRNTLFVGSDVSMNANLYVNNDLSLNGNLYVVKRSLFALDVSINGNIKLGSGTRSVAINKDISSAFALDVSGLTVLRNTLYVGSDVSMNANLYVNNDLSLNGNLYVSKRSLFTLDVSINGNVKLGSGTQSVAINKDISSAFALDVSGLTVLRNTLYVGSDVSMNANLYVNNDLSLNGNLYVVKRSLFTLDVSMNGNVKLGSGTRSVAINKDISSAFALDVSGLTVLRNTLYVGSDVSMNANLYVNNDLSLNGNLYVVKRSLFTLDVSMSQNLDIGTGSNSVAINKDISSAFALDVSGLTVLRNTLYVGSDVSMNANLYVNNDLSLNGNLYVVKRSLFTLDVSMSQNLDIGSGSNSVAINKDISSAFALDVSGLTVLRNTLYVGSDVSMNANLYVNNDLSLNGNLYVVKRSLFTLDVSMSQNLDIGTGSNSVAINKDISSAFALDVSGLTVLRNTLYVGSDVSMNANLYVNNDLSLNGNLYVNKDLSLNGNLYVVKRSLFTLDVSMSQNLDIGTGSNSVAINKDISSAFALDVSGLTVLRNTLYVGSDVSMNANLYVNNDLSLNGNLYVVKRSLFTLDVSMSQNLDIGTGSNSVAINKDISSAFALDVSGLTVLRNTLYVGSDVSMNANLYVNNDLSLNGNLYVVKRSLFTLDVSMNGNVKLGSGTRSVAINKDISSAFALDVSGLTVLRNTLYVGSDVSMNANLYVNNDLSLNGNLYVSKRSLFTLDVSMNGNVKLGSGTRSVAINKDISSAFALDVSGLTVLRNTLYVGSDVSMNANLYVNNDLSLNGNLYVSKRSLFTLDVSMNGNVKLGSGTRSVAINKDISSAFALDVSGLTVLRNTLYVGSDVSMNANLYVHNDLSLNGNLYVSKRSLFTLDVSMSQNLDIGTGSNSVAINKDISSAFALDVSGLTVLRNTLYVGSDVSMNANLYVNNDLSLNGNLYVVKRSLFTLDVSMSGNLDIGSGSNSVAINKDISSAFALDVSGATKFRGAMDVAGVFTVNGEPISAGGSLTGNVQVGTNSGFVTVDKPQFYSDPSLTIYYNFDTSYNTGTKIYNFGNLGSGYDGVFNVTPGSTTGMIDTTIFNNGNQINSSIASFKNDPALNNFGIRIGTGTVPVSSTMSFSFWLYKKSRTIGTGDWDRVFQFSDLTSGSTSENNTIALDVSFGGNIFPVITKGGASPSSLITPSLPILSYDLGASAWNHVVWTINGTKSSIYINGSLTQNDTLSENITLNTPTQRNTGTIAFSYTSTGGSTRDFSGNIDDFRYYNQKALNYAEIYQLYNNNFYTLDICGGFLANGSSVIYEAVGSVATANSGTLTLLHGDASGSSSIMFKSVNNPLDYGYVEYDENVTGSTGYNYGLMTIGIEKDGGSGAYTAQADRISLFPSGGQGFVGVNTKTPVSALDVSGLTVLRNTLYVGSDVSMNANLYVNNDLSLNGNLYVVKRSLFTLDVSINGNVKLGSGTQSVAINKDISSAFALDVSGTLNTNSDAIINNMTVGRGPQNHFSNMAIGYQAFNTNTSGYQNVAVGYQALKLSVSGYNNVAVGYEALQNITSQNSNTAIGFGAGNGETNNYVGDCNTFIGSNTFQNGTGSNNTYIGYQANTAGTYSNSTAVGYYATITASNQIKLGTSTETVVCDGSLNVNNLLLINCTVPNSSVDDVEYLSNIKLMSSDYGGEFSGGLKHNRYGFAQISTIASGTKTERMRITGNGQVGIGTTNPQYTLDVNGNVNATSYNASSDYRIKKNVVPLDLTFNVDVLKPVSYVLKDDKDSKLQIGFIAHEVQEFYPFLVNGEKDGQQTQSINYNGFIGVLTKEIQVLKKKVADQEAQSAKALAKAADQEQRISALEKMVSDLINK